MNDGGEVWLGLKRARFTVWPDVSVRMEQDFCQTSGAAFGRAQHSKACLLENHISRRLDSENSDGEDLLPRAKHVCVTKYVCVT